jgi:LuxR family quorum sensing-dependent transcriptional regulator
MPGRLRMGMAESPRDVFAFIDSLERLSTLDEVTDALNKALARSGIESFIVTELPTKDQPFEQFVIASRWPPEFFMLYVKHGYARIDPLNRRCIQSHMPFEWRSDSYRLDPDPRVAEMMRRASEFGLKDGYVVPIHGPCGYEGCVSMAGAALHLSDNMKASIHLMALYAFERLRAIRGEFSDRKRSLTPREREVLTWAAQGRSAAQISKTLKISKRTVDEHSQTAARKLGASNRTQAVAIAMRGHMIEV